MHIGAEAVIPFEMPGGESSSSLGLERLPARLAFDQPPEASWNPFAEDAAPAGPGGIGMDAVEPSFSLEAEACA